jgi:hypothetical protein
MPIVPAFGRLESGGMKVLGQPGLHSETLSQKKKKNKKPKNKQEASRALVAHVCNPSYLGG